MRFPPLSKQTRIALGMWGHSMGGGVTMKVLTIDPACQGCSAVFDGQCG